MATWEIRFLEHPSMQLEADEQRDLALEYRAHVARKVRRHVDRLWTPITGVVLNAGMVLSVQRLPKRSRKKAKSIGFAAE